MLGRHPRHLFLATLLLAATAVLAACGPTATSAGPSTRPVVTPPATPTTRATPASSAGTSASPAAGASFDPTGQQVKADVVVSGLSSPVDVTDAGDGSGRLFVVEQPGTIRIVRDGALVDTPFLDIRDRIASGGERGLLGLAFHPGYPSDPRFFVDYTDLQGNTVIASYKVSAANPDVADRDSETVILRMDQPFANHNGGATIFGPDGMLYIGMGDGGSGGDPQGNGQRLDTYLAKVLRLDIDGGSASGQPYAIPADNPFVSDPNAKHEIWLTGLRNPWRMRFDTKTGDLWIGDVGQNAWEEVDVARAGIGGLNFGWNRMEGFHCYQPASGCDQTGLTLPVAEYGHDAGCAIVGGVVVRDPRQGRLDGGYLFGDACSDNLWLIDPAGDAQRTPVIVAKLGRTLSSINAAKDGTVYATSLAHGELLRLSAVSPSGT